MQNKESLKEQVQMIKSTAESIVISNEEELQNATNFLKELKTYQKRVKDFFEPMVKATKESYDKIRWERDSLLKPLKAIEDDMRGLMNDYNNKIMQLKKAEEERIRREQEENELKLRNLQKDIKQGNTENVQEKMEEILNTTTLPETTVEIPKVQGMSTRTTYKIEVTDISKIPAQLNGVPLLELSKIGKDYLIKEYKIQKALKKNFEVPGVLVKEEVTTVLR